MQTGIVVFDLKGNHYLETFDGYWPIPESTIKAAWDAIQQSENTDMENERLAGRLARGIISDDVVTQISYRIFNREWPDRSAYGN